MFEDSEQCIRVEVNEINQKWKNRWRHVSHVEVYHRTALRAGTASEEIGLQLTSGQSGCSESAQISAIYFPLSKFCNTASLVIKMELMN